MKLPLLAGAGDPKMPLDGAGVEPKEKPVVDGAGLCAAVVDPAGAFVPEKVNV
jgi:hypothetical protein